MKRCLNCGKISGSYSSVMQECRCQYSMQAPTPPIATQHERKPLNGVLVPLNVLEAAEESLGSFCSDHGWADEDMQNMDSLSAYIAEHKAAHGIKEKNHD